MALVGLHLIPDLLEYQLSTPYDLTTISLNINAGIELEDEITNPNSNEI